MPGSSFHRLAGLSLLVLAAISPNLCAQTPTPLPFSMQPAPSASPSAGFLFPDLPEHSSNRYVPPKLVKRLPVAYPETAHLNRATGVVGLLFYIDETGKVTRVVVGKSSGIVALDAVVLDYNLQHWEFAPATLDGKPVPSTKEEEFEFRLDAAEEHAIAVKRLALPVGTPDCPYPKEALALPQKPRGSVTVSVRWTKLGLVDLIYLPKTSGSNTLDRAALRWAYENWHVDPATLNDKNKDAVFTKTMNFVPPPAPPGGSHPGP